MPINTIAMLGSLYYLGGAILLAVGDGIYGKDKTSKTMQDIDQQILELIKTNDKEMEILREHDKIEAISNEIKNLDEKIAKLISSACYTISPSVASQVYSEVKSKQITAENAKEFEKNN